MCQSPTEGGSNRFEVAADVESWVSYARSQEGEQTQYQAKLWDGTTHKLSKFSACCGLELMKLLE